MRVVTDATVELSQFDTDAVHIRSEWGRVHVSEDGMVFDMLRGSSFQFSVPADEIASMCFSWMREQRRHRDEKNIAELEKSNATKS